MPRGSRSRVAGPWSCHGFDLVVAEFVFDRGEHAEGGVAPSAVVEDLKVFEDRVGQFEVGLPALAVEQFGLHAAQNDSIIALS